MKPEAITPENIHSYLRLHQEKELCRFVTVGSVDDGKSTLIGRLLHDTHGIYEDQLAAVKKATKQEGGEVDFSLFTDGLKAEREQGITIDVAYRYFSTEKRKFIIADTPGHVQYTRNMATGASTANVAIILIDARLGVLQQSRRHAYIAHLLGIPHLAVCVNKMDLEGYKKEIFDKIRAEFTQFTAALGFREVKFIPISAKAGVNVVHSSPDTPWYPTAEQGGGTLLEYLETVPVDAGINRADFRFPIQYVIRPNLDYRGFAGTIASGSVKKGDRLVTLPSRKSSRVKSIDTFDGEIERAAAPMAVTIRFEDEIDSSRGDMLILPDNEPLVLDRFEAKMVWLNEHALDRAHTYLLKQTTQMVRANVDAVNYIVDLETLEHRSARHLELNDIGSVTISAHKSLFVDPYQKNHATGAFILIDPITNNTVAAGMVEGVAGGGAHAKAGPRLESKVGPAECLERMGRAGAIVWLTGLPASGKSAIGYELERQLFDGTNAAVVVDPEDGLGRGTISDGSSPVQTPELARRFADAGLLCIFAYASPHRADRDAVRSAVGDERFIEVYVATSSNVCKMRDERGFYDAGHLDPSYEEPVRPDLVVALDGGVSVADAARSIKSALVERGLAR